MEVLHDKQSPPDEQTETVGVKDVHPSTLSQTIPARADNSPSFTSTTSSTNMLISQRQQRQQQDKEQVDYKENDEQEYEQDEQEPELEQANKNENETYYDNQLRGLYKKSNKSKMSGNKTFGSRKNMDSFSINSTPTKNNNISEPPRTQSLSMLLTINKPPPRNGKKGDSKHSGLARLLSIIYAILIIICGFIFPFVEILQDQWLETWYNGIHIFYLYTLGTLIFIYMQVVLALPSSDCCRKNHSRTASSSGEMSGQIRNHYVNHGFATTNSAKLHEQNSMKKPNKELNIDIDLDNKLASQYNISNQEQNTRKQKIENSTSFNAKKTHAHKQLITAVLKFNSTTRLNSSSNINRSSTTNLPTDEKNEDEMSETIQRHNSMLEEIPTVDEETCEEEKMEEVFIDLSELGSIFSHNGSSFFLRIGTLLFGVGHIIYIILEIQQSLMRKPGCELAKFWWVFISRLLFVVVQTFVFFKNPVFVVRRSQKVFFRFGFMHLIATNFCVWTRTLISEIILEANYLNKNNASNTSTPTFLPKTSYNCYTGILQIAAPYLFPFVMEYSLLCISVAFVMYFSISEESRDNIEKGITNLFKIDVFEKDSSEEIEKDKLKSSKLDHRHPHGLSESEELFSKSHRGIYTGFMFLTGIIVCIVFFNFSYGNWDDPIKGETISLSCALSMAIILLLVAFFALVQMRVLSIINKPSSIDDYLLIIAMFGGLTYLLCIIMSGFNALNNGVYRSSTLETLRICMGFCGMAQLIVQVVLIISGLRQYPSKQSHVDLKPGRGPLTFLVIANVSAWIFHSVLTKTHDLQYSPTNLFNKVAWIILINITVPLLLFFYFHSSVCLADIWHQAYVPLQHNVHKPHGNQDHLNHALSHHDDLKADDVFSETLPSLKPLARTQPQQRSAISYLSPLIRSVSVSQLIQTRNISSNNFDDKSCNRSLSEIPQRKRTFPSPRDEDNYKDNAYNEYREYIHM